MTADRKWLVLILAPLGRDSELFESVLKDAGIVCAVCRNVPCLEEEIVSGAAVALIAEEALSSDNVSLLSSVLHQQSGWSDLPVLLMTSGGEVTEDSRLRLEMSDPLGNVTLIERPLRTVTLLSAVRTALRARERQYKIRDQLEEQNRFALVLRENEERLKFALEAAALGSWEIELPERNVVVSDQTRRNFGLSLDADVSYDRLSGMIHAEDRARVIGELGQALREASIFQTEFRIIRHDGLQCWIYATGRPVRGASGKVLRFAGVTMDITERRKGEEAIRESERQLRIMADSIPQLASIARADGSVFWYNRGWFEYTGKTIEELGGDGWMALHHPEMLPRVIERWEQSFFTGEDFEMEFPLRGSSGAFRWFLARAKPLRNAHGEIVRWFGTNTDIDDKKLAEIALRESEELARSVIQSSPDCVELLDQDGTTLLINAAGERLLGGAQMIRMPGQSWVNRWMPDDRGKAVSAFNVAISGFQNQFQARSEGLPGEARWWDVIVSPIKASEGSPVKILCVSRDVTKRRLAEEQLRETAKLESLGVMAGGIAHDFNNLLTGILGNASLLRDNSRGENRDFAEEIVLASERAANLTKQMLAYSGRGQFQITRINLAETVREMLRLIRPTIHQDVDLVLDMCKQPCHLEGDPGQVQQVIMNLVINAGESFDGRPGKVHIRTSLFTAEAESELSVSLGGLIPGEYVMLEVCDTGKGMDASTKARIFDPFFTTKFTGRGLGLAAVSGIVRGHRGVLCVDSEVGQGTTFKVLFPAMKVIDEPEPMLRTKRRGHGRGLVLLADDEEMVQRVAATALQRHGFEVAVACNGQEAVDFFSSNHPRLVAVILDLTMPIMDGEEALRRIKEISARVPIIVCSGYNEIDVVKRFPEHKIAAFLQKPYSASMLGEKMNSVLD